MIYRLQRKFIIICTCSVLALVFLMFGLFTAFNIVSLNRNLDVLADSVSEGGGRFPEGFHQDPPPQKGEPGERDFAFITSETPFATRHFSVWFDDAGEAIRVNTESIHSVSEEEAEALALGVIKKGSERGWVSGYRYKMMSTPQGFAVVFIDGGMNMAALVQSVTICALVLLGCAALVILMAVLISGRAVKPIAESYEKQRQFITDANHELKTPLTLMLANLDIAQSELGENEWLEDMRTEGHRMTALVNQLVELSRMDEESVPVARSEIALGEIALDTVSDFSTLSEERGTSISHEIDTSLRYVGDEVLLRRLLSIFLDNAVKYCDDGGEITVRLEKRRHVVLSVENTYIAVDNLELDRLFDRFYRADRARSFTGGYGIGLSLAKAIAEKHGGEVLAYKKGAKHIGFKAVLK